MEKRYLIENIKSPEGHFIITEEKLFAEANKLSSTPVFMLINAIEILEKSYKKLGEQRKIFELKNTHVDLSIDRLKEFQQRFKEEKVSKVITGFKDQKFPTNMYQLSLIYGIPVCVDNFEALRGQEPSPFIRMFGSILNEYVELWTSFCNEEEKQFGMFNFGRLNTIDEAFMRVFEHPEFEGAIFFHLLDDDPNFATILKKQSAEVSGDALLQSIDTLLETHLEIYRQYISNNE